MRMFGFFLALLLVGEGFGGRSTPECDKIKFKNGRVRYRQRGRMARFLCNKGFTLAGDMYNVCLKGKWENSNPKCVRGTCPKAKQEPLNGFIYPSHGGGVLNFYCKSNYQIRGANITYCDGLTWDNPLPTCLQTNTPPALSCDFEREDICGWNHDLNHDFDWKRLNYGTPSGSIGTGPSHDHTKGNGQDGYYMYIESSARNPNDTARLISPVYDKTTTDTCFEFYYHMYGLATGDLRVFLKKTSETWDLDPKKALFDKNGNQGNKWFRAFLQLGVIDDDYQIIIEGVRGSSYVSDIAIDDVRIIKNCTHQDEIWEPTTTAEPLLSTDPPIIVESCQNRCDTTDNRPSKAMITCDCDDDCYGNNRCCPDYFDYCVFKTTLDDFTGETLAGSTVAADTSPPPSATTTTTTITTTKPTSTQNPTTAELPTTVETPTKESKKPDDVTAEPPPNEGPADNDKSMHQKIVIQPKITESNTRTVIFAVGVVFGVLFGVVGMAFVARRYRLLHCGNLRRMKQSSHGDSQSDVRFLTGDEVLDLNLPSGYDTM